MPKLSSAILCHGIDEGLNAVVLRDYFDTSDVTVCLRLEYSELPIYRPFVQVVTWTHESGKATSMQDEIIPNRTHGVVVSVLSPWTITSEGCHPRGIWRVQVDVQGKTLLSVCFLIKDALHTPPKIVDVIL